MTKPVFKTTKKAAKKGASLASYSLDFSEGDYLFREGDLGTEMFILQEGKVEILQQREEGEEVLAVLDKGDFFGEMSLLEDLPRTASARAATDVKVIQINGTTFDQMLRSKPEIAVRIMRKLSRRLRQTDEMLKKALGDSTFARGPLPEIPAPQEKEERSRAPQKLVHLPSGTELHLASDGDTLIGRRDPVTGINPDVDLTPADTQRSTSRRHAKIYRKEGIFHVCEEIGTMNGTFVNGQRVETGVPVEIHHGDEVQFGLVKLVFRAE